MTIYNNASEVWSAINAATSIDQIKSILNDSNTSDIVLDPNDLRTLALSQSVDVGGAKTAILYAGTINSGLPDTVYSGDIARNIANSSRGTVAIIDNTAASVFVGSNEFRGAINVAFNNDAGAIREFLNGTTTSSGTRTSHGLFGDLSEKFITQNPFTEVRTISATADLDSILFQKEISSILHNSDSTITKIDGIELSELRSTLENKGLTDVIDNVKQSSGAHFTLLETGKDINGNLLIGTGEFFRNSQDVEISHLPNDATDIKSGAILLGRDSSWLGSKLLSASTLNKLGTAGDIISFAFAAKEAEAAIAAGDNARASTIMQHWTADFLGGAAGSYVAVLAATPLIMTLAPGAIVGGTLLIASAIVGGVYGGPKGVYLLEKAKELGVIIQDELRDDVADFTDAAKEHLNSFLDDVITIGTSLQSALNSLHQAELPIPVRRIDPLTLDLDYDGIELVDVRNSKAFFDLDLRRLSGEEYESLTNPESQSYNQSAQIYSFNNPDGTISYYLGDGVKEQVGWISADDGLLTLDKNNNGTIDNILELFGKQDKTGTEELREYDLNDAAGANGVADGVINNQDAVFSKLKIWQDRNQNGISEANELKTLTELGIKEIKVSPDSITLQNYTQNGNLIISKGQFTQEVTNPDGTRSEVTKSYANLDLAVNQTNSSSYSYTDPEGNIIGDYDLDLEVFFNESNQPC